MTEKKETNNATLIPAPRKCKWYKWSAWCLSGLLLIHMVFPLGVQLWQTSSLPSDAPRFAFTPNDTWLRIFHVNEAYQISFALAHGKLVEIQPNDTGPNQERIKVWLEENQIDGVLLTGGGDVDPRLYGSNPEKATLVNRARDDFELALLKVAMEKKLPVLGICRGCQLLNVARGGTLKDLRAKKELKNLHFNMTGHQAELTKDSRLAKIMATDRLASVQSFHYQAVQDLGRGLRVSARGPDNVIEAIEDTSDSWIVAVQWHPELSLNDPHQNTLLEAFVKEAKDRSRD